MPLIKGKSQSLLLGGARVPLTIARPVDLPAAATCTDRTDVLALIDTGADYTCIRQSLADEMRLQQVDEKMFTNSTGHQTHRIYLCDLIFSEDEQRRTYAVAGCTFAESVEFLIGRDFLEQARLLYDGRTGQFELEF